MTQIIPNIFLVGPIAILLLPIVGFAILSQIHNKVPRHGDWYATTMLGVSLALSCYLAWISSSDSRLVFAAITFPWLPLSESVTLTGGILVDRLTIIMLVVVTTVSFLVHLFSTKYMEGDIRYGRYYCGLQLFTASMLGLVLADNLLFLFIFWELVGLSSYLLIGHWFEKRSASNAAIKAFITTRVGDVGMMLGLLLCYTTVGSLQYADIFAAVDNGSFTGTARTLAALGIFFGAMGKSAQFPLHVWLPDAMEGPTPVSALIHAATMVAAGVYLTGRLLPLFDPNALIVVAHVGAVTALFAATIAVVQTDIKKVLAYSTVSQLGYMILALGVGGFCSGLFHLTTHAFFKAGLFLGAGAVIYGAHHEQDIMKFGGLGKRMPKVMFCYLACTLALVGFPGTSGFWSKDAILADTLLFAKEHGYYFLVFASFTTVFLTAFYMFRQFFLTFTGKPRDNHIAEHAHDASWEMLVPLVVLGTLALISGGFGKWFPEYLPKQTAAQQVTSISVAELETMHRPLTNIKPIHEVGHSEHSAATEQAHEQAMLFSTILGLLGIAISALFYLERKNKAPLLSSASVVKRVQPLFHLLSKKYFMDELYHHTIVRGQTLLSVFCASFDRKVIDLVVNLSGKAAIVGSVIAEICDRVGVDHFAVMGTARSTGFLGEKLSLVQSGYVRNYLLFTAMGLVVLALLVISL